MSELQRKLGRLLELERQRQNIELSELAAELKTSEHYLQCIEAGDASSLPSGLYFGLFAKSYAEALGIDYTATVEAIKRDIGILEEVEGPESESTEADEADSAETQRKRGGRSDKEASSPFVKLAYLLGAIVILFGVFVAINKFLLSDHEDAHQDNEFDATSEVRPPSSSDRGADSELANYNWDVPAYEESPQMVLRMTARSECWSAVTADGDTAVFRTLSPGQVYEVVAKYRMNISVGVPSAVDLTLNGQPVDLAHPETGRIHRVEIDQLNLASALSGPRDLYGIQEEATATIDRPHEAETPRRTYIPVDTLVPTAADTSSLKSPVIGDEQSTVTQAEATDTTKQPGGN